jgi:predicted nucleic acid-binding protein
MEPSDLGVILDSSIAIEAERQQLNVSQFLLRTIQKIGQRQVALSSITIAELAHGIYRANTPHRRDRRRLFLDELKTALPVYPVTDITAELVGKIGGESSAKGVNIPIDDILIGACALERGYAIATRNIRHFREIPGLSVIDF